MIHVCASTTDGPRYSIGEERGAARGGGEEAARESTQIIVVIACVGLGAVTLCQLCTNDRP